MIESTFKQANESLKTFNTSDKEALVYNLVEALMFVTEDTQEKIIYHLRQVNEELGNTIEKQLQI